MGVIEGIIILILILYLKAKLSGGTVGSVVRGAEGEVRDTAKRNVKQMSNAKLEQTLMSATMKGDAPARIWAEECEAEITRRKRVGKY